MVETLVVTNELGQKTQFFILNDTTAERIEGSTGEPVRMRTIEWSDGQGNYLFTMHKATGAFL